MLKRAISDENGRILVWTLVILGLGALLIPVLLARTNTNLVAARTVEEGLKEQYAADSGVEYAMLQLQKGITTSLKPYTYTINNKGVEVTWGEYVAETYKITSTATSQTFVSSTTIESYISSAEIMPSVFDHAAVALGSEENCDLDFRTNFQIGSIVHEGDVYANGNICLGNNTAVDGDAVATGTISCPTENCDEISGEKVPDAPPIDAPDIDMAALLAEANEEVHDDSLSITGNGIYPLGPLHIKGNLSIGGNRTVVLGGTVYVDGNISMQGNAEIQGGYTIVADGTISLQGNPNLDLEDFPFVISTESDITITGNNYTSAVVYAPQGNIVFNGNGKLYGAAVGERVIGQGSASVDIEYPPDLVTDRGLPGGVVGLEINTYRVYP